MATRSGRHAADDGSFGRSAGTSVLKGAGLLAIAVIIGILLLQANDDGDRFGTPVVAGSRSTTTAPGTTAPSATTTTSIQARPPAQIKVLTANGTNTSGLAGTYKDKARAAGYNTLAPTDTQKKGVAVSTVYFTTGYEPEARVLATTLGIPATAVKAMPTPPPVANLQGANLLVVVGQDKASTVSTTSTTRRGATTTTRRGATTTSTTPTSTSTSSSRSRAATTTTAP